MTEVLQHVKQCVVLSGKGGTGKTSIAASLMHQISQQVSGVYVDADVDAANLALLTGVIMQDIHEFSGSKLAVIDPKICTACGHCFDVCRFNAIRAPACGEQAYQVKGMLCEGCAACVHRCPEKAIHMDIQKDGEWYHALSSYGHLFHAALFPAAENSGKLVAEIRQHAVEYAEDHQTPFILIDGPPGIGCPVISASTGVDLVVLVAEPGVSGQHDLVRIIQTMEHFNIPAVICINKFDQYLEGTNAIRRLAEARGYQIISEIPFDPAVPKSMVQGMPITAFEPGNPTSLEIMKMSKVLLQMLLP
jgi:MinD superfamily P-loop ATPase